TTSAVFFISRGRFRTRHMRGLRLDQKFASAESIRVFPSNPPIITNYHPQSLFQIALSIYSINCTPYPVGEDPTKLSHAYDMLAAYKSAFIPCFLFFKYRKIQKRHAIEASVDDKRRSFEEGKQKMILIDWISCALWVLEITIWLIGSILVFPAARFLATDAILHFNFRAIFLTLFIRNFLGSADRITVIIARTFLYGLDPLPFQVIVGGSMIYHMSQVGVTYTAISIERLISIVDSRYEHRTKSISSKILLITGIVLAYSISPTLTMIFFAANLNGIPSYFVYASYGLAGIANETAFQSSQIAYRISKKKLRNRHVLRLQLNQKFASTENIRAMHLFIPCVTNECLCFIILLAAYKSSFAPCFITYKYNKMRADHIKASHPNSRPSIINHIDTHFKDLQSSWK
ncbi:hypothetical protein PFISCL1PPCAC_19258, partial [Pristionchus fissidentatus]